MATLVLTAVGTAVGGPLGGALGALAGRSLDAAIIGSPRREGARLKDLSVTTSSYGSVIPRHFGRVRAAGSVIWATDLVETQEKSGGGKGKPKVTTYSYSVSFAVALANRPIASIGRVWADGNLLRGTSGDLKVGGELRLYTGHGDQPVDALLASDVGEAECPAFRKLAYCVFENLDLAAFGNRIPALTFEIFADDAEVELPALIGPSLEVQCDVSLPELAGFSHEGGSIADMLELVNSVYPIASDAMGGMLSVKDMATRPGATVHALGPAARSANGFGRTSGISRERSGSETARQVSLRYYDIARDYQPGLQRSRARAGNGTVQSIEFPASLAAKAARRLAGEAASRRLNARETIAFRMAQLDPKIAPGSLVKVTGEAGIWRVRSWEWQPSGIELELDMLAPHISLGTMTDGDSGAVRPPVDETGGTTTLAAFGLPWDGIGDGSTPVVAAAVSSPSPGWTGSALFSDPGSGSLIPIGAAKKDRAVMGVVQGIAPFASPHVFDRSTTIIVELESADLVLSDSTADELASGSNRARIGDEIIQFARATSVGGATWKLSGLLRGRGGTEWAIGFHREAERFVILDDRITLLDATLVTEPPAEAIVALGTLDVDPVRAAVSDSGATLRPLQPVHGSIERFPDGSLGVTWTRRSRGAWRWLNEVEVPLNEMSEAYDVLFRATDGSQFFWRVDTNKLIISPAVAINPTPGSGLFEIRQIGSRSLSRPLILPL